MNKLFALTAILSILCFTISLSVKAQGTSSGSVKPAEVKNAANNTQNTATVTYPVEQPTAGTEKRQSIHSTLKQKFIEGGPWFMTAILICFILGEAIAIERIVYLNLASTNNKKLLAQIEQALNAGGIQAAKQVCLNTRGPVATIFYHGLDRSHEGLEVVEKTVVAYGGVQTSLLEKGLVWIALFIALGPMLGFLGTVIGMVKAFDAIAAAGSISPSMVAGGIKVALITTIAGLIVAMILQIFYNYSVNKIDSIVNKMEDASVSLIDLLVKYNSKITSA